MTAKHPHAWREFHRASVVFADALQAIEELRGQIEHFKQPEDRDLRPVPLKKWDPGDPGWPTVDWLQKLRSRAEYNPNYAPFKTCFAVVGERTVLFHPERFYQLIERLFPEESC